jgi:cell division protein FtsB
MEEVLKELKDSYENYIAKLNALIQAKDERIKTLKETIAILEQTIELLKK